MNIPVYLVMLSTRGLYEDVGDSEDIVKIGDDREQLEKELTEKYGEPKNSRYSRSGTQIWRVHDGFQIHEYRINSMMLPLSEKTVQMIKERS